MSQRDSGYARIERDGYQTPSWVTLALLPHLPAALTVWECAAGSGQMATALAAAGFEVIATDIADGQDFLCCPAIACDAIVTNPPYELATEFITHALELTKPCGLVAMLLRTDFDHAATRSGLFQCPAFARKIVLTRRIKWFEGSTGQPSFNHAWFIWDWRHQGPPMLAYGPRNGS